MSKRELKKVSNYVYGVLVLFLILLSSGIVGYVETHYLKECTVYEVNGDVVTFEDRNGNLWDFEFEDSDSNFKNEKQKYILTFDNNTTDNILTDDKIVKIKIKNENRKRKGN